MPHIKQVFILILEIRDFRQLAYVSRIHWQKTFLTLSYFFRERGRDGGRGGGDGVVWLMISANVKADVKQQEIKELVAVFCIFIKN